MTTGNAGAVYFLGSRAYYQAQEQPYNYGVENGYTSTETIYGNTSVELRSNVQANWQPTDLDPNYRPETVCWHCISQTANNDTVIYDKTKSVGFVKKRVKRKSNEALLSDEMKPAVLNNVEDKKSDLKKKKSRRFSFLSFLSSLRPRKKRVESEQAKYLRNMESALNCTYKESCRCWNCQSHYFDCVEESEFSSDDSDSPYSQDVKSQAVAQLADAKVQAKAPKVMDDDEAITELEMEVAVNTSTIFHALLYNPSCNIQ